MSTISTIEIKLQIKGHATGTLGWFKAWIEDAELVIRKTRFGIPGLFLHEKHNRKGEENKAHEGNSWLCHVATDSDYDTGCRARTINGIKYVYPYVYAPGWASESSLIDYPVTPACEKAVQEFIDKAVEKFAEWYEVQ